MEWDDKSRLLDAREAQRMHYGALALGDALIWRIYDCTDRIPPYFIARPIMVSQSLSSPVNVHLQAASLEELRKLLPGDLHRIPRGAELDSDALEQWV